jgi:tripartite ATP-independent transporter DctP family solute receptor
MAFGKFVATSIAAAMVAGAIAAPASAKEFKISFGPRADFASEIYTAGWIVKNYVNDNSKTLKVTLYPNSGLGDVVPVYEAMRLGSGASCQISGTAELNGFYKRLGVFDLPFLWKSYEHANKVFDSPVAKEISDEFEKAVGIRIISFMDSWGYRNVATSKADVHSIADLKGLKIRTLQSPVYVAALKLLGANATPMGYSEVYTAMKTGVLDGYEVTPSMIQAQKFYEVSKYVVRTHHLFSPVVLACSSQQWNSLTAEEKKVFEEGAKLASDINRALAPVREAESVAFLKKQGMIIRDIDMTSLTNDIPKTQEEMAEKLGGADLLKKIVDLSK